MRRRHRLLSLAFLVAALGPSGCVTTATEGAALRSDIDQLKTEMAEQHKREDDLRADVGKKLAVMQSRVVELEETLSTLRQADADSGVQMEKVIAELQELRGDVEEARFQLGETKKSVADILERPPVSVAAAEGAPRLLGDPLATLGGLPIPADKAALYELGKKLFDDKKYDDALAAFDLYTVRHADDKELLDNAWFWKGEAHYARAGTLPEKKQQADAYRQAVLAYQKVLQHPKANKADGALFKIGLAFEALGFAGEAKVFYEELLAKYPKSDLAKEAKKRLQTVSKASSSKKKKKR